MARQQFAPPSVHTPNDRTIIIWVPILVSEFLGVASRNNQPHKSDTSEDFSTMAFTDEAERKGLPVDGDDNSDVEMEGKCNSIHIP